MFKRLLYLIAEGFEICSLQTMNADESANAKILYRTRNPSGKWRLQSEEFQIGEPEGEACGKLFISYLSSGRAS